MGMTLAQKILARASGRESVAPGEMVAAAVDLALSHENADLVRKSFDEGGGRVWNAERLVIVLDHLMPAESEQTASTHKSIRDFVRREGIRAFYDVGRGGVCHQVLADNGRVLPGMFVAGTASHMTTHGAFGAFAAAVRTDEMARVWREGKLECTVPETVRIEVQGELRRWISAKDVILYIVGQLGAAGAADCAVEFDGPVIRALSVAGRMVITNVAAEMSARAVFTPVDDRVLHYLTRRAARILRPDPRYAADVDAAYSRMLTVNVTEVLKEPQVACPHAVDRVRPLSEVAGLAVNQAVIGGCSNGRLEDMEIAAGLLEGHRVHPRTRLIVTPASQEVYLEAIHMGFVQTLIAAGAVVNPPGCGPCAGAHQGVLAPGEVCISSTNGNCAGRMGSRDSRVYLASPAVVAASAIAGAITHPSTISREVAA